VTQPVHVGNGPTALAAGDGVVWVANSLDGTASRIDATTGSVTAAVPVGDGPSGLAVDGKSTWVTNQFGGTLSRIGGGRGAADTERVGNAPLSLVVVGGKLFVTVGAAGTAHRGGTLVLESMGGPDFLDPALAYTTWSWQMLIMTNDGLVGFRRVGGPDGVSIVPDLATSVPAPTDGGKTYTFQLRSGIRYSTGDPVKASDVRSSVERLFRVHSPVAYYYRGIVGGAVCAKDPSTCDLSRGILTDDATGSVTFHLSAPDAEFLYKLALPFADLLPAGVADPTTSTTVPATGPYEISAYTPARGKQQGKVVLVRNPQFREWSVAVQPDGYADRIEYTTGVDPERFTTDIEQGHADAALDTPPADRTQEITTRFTDQTHTYARPTTNGIVLNTTLAPFNDIRVRRAVNDAMDRGAVVSAVGSAVPTCQLIPPNFQGYRPFCPSTLNPSPDGKWSAPDLPRAHRLVAASQTAGTKVTVWATSTIPPFVAMARAFVSELNALGYRATLRTIDNVDKFFSFIQNSDNDVQAAPYGWLSDYPAASNFLNLVRCSRFVSGSGQNLNAAELCDPKLDARIERALDVQSTDPAAAGALWAAADRRAVMDAPWVFVFNDTGLDFVSKRVGNYQHNPQWGVLLDQLWVK